MWKRILLPHLHEEETVWEDQVDPKSEALKYHSGLQEVPDGHYFYYSEPSSLKLLSSDSGSQGRLSAYPDSPGVPEVAAVRYQGIRKAASFPIQGVTVRPFLGYLRRYLAEALVPLRCQGIGGHPLSGRPPLLCALSRGVAAQFAQGLRSSPKGGLAHQLGKVPVGPSAESYLSGLLDRLPSAYDPTSGSEGVPSNGGSVTVQPEPMIRTAIRVVGLMTSAIPMVQWAQFHARKLQE